MSTRPFAYNPSGNISGTQQFGSLTVGTPVNGFESQSVKFWNGPEELNGIIIVAYPDPEATHIGADGTPAQIGFVKFDNQLTFKQWCENKTSNSFVDGAAAKTNLLANGYWTNFDEIYGSMPTATPVPNPTATPSNEQITSGVIVTIQESGSDLLFTANGSLNINDLTFLSTTNLGGGGMGPGTGTWIIGANANMDTYAGINTTSVVLGTNNGGAAMTSSTGDILGVVYQGQPPYQLAVPAGYVSGDPISSSAILANHSFLTFGLTQGTYTYSWGSGANAESLTIIIGNGNSGGGGTPSPTATPGENGGGSGSWYFYSDAGLLNANAPIQDGNTIFIIRDNQNNTMTETFNPNKLNGVNEIYFNLSDSTGTDYTTQFTALQNNGGTISITQGANTVTYTSATPGAFFVESQAGFFIIQTGPAIQTVTVASPFVYSDPISISFS